MAIIYGYNLWSSYYVSDIRYSIHHSFNSLDNILRWLSLIDHVLTLRQTIMFLAFNPNFSHADLKN